MIHSHNRFRNLPPIFRNLHQISQNLLNARNLESGFSYAFSMGCEVLARFRMPLSGICSEICFYSTKSISYSRFQISVFPTLRGVCPPITVGHVTSPFLVLRPIPEPIQTGPP